LIDDGWLTVALKASNFPPGAVVVRVMVQVSVPPVKEAKFTALPNASVNEADIWALNITAPVYAVGLLLEVVAAPLR
jgi:hypothetical protein